MEKPQSSGSHPPPPRHLGHFRVSLAAQTRRTLSCPSPKPKPASAAPLSPPLSAWGPVPCLSTARPCPQHTPIHCALQLLARPQDPGIGGLYLAPDPPDPQSGAEGRKGHQGPGFKRLEPAWPPLFLFLLHLPGSTGASPGPRPPAALRTGVSSCHRLPPFRLNSFPPSTGPGHLLLRPGHPARPPALSGGLSSPASSFPDSKAVKGEAIFGSPSSGSFPKLKALSSEAANPALGPSQKILPEVSVGSGRQALVCGPVQC